jgi:hypothetical protein
VTHGRANAWLAGAAILALVFACLPLEPPKAPASVADVEAAMHEACRVALQVCNLDELRPDRAPRDVQTCADVRKFCAP